jgi:hypothetical protein
MTQLVDTLAELTPLVRRAAGLDPATLVRVRLGRSSVSALVRLPFAVLAGRSVRVHPHAVDADYDRTYRADELLAWLDERTPEPATRDADWRGGVPPLSQWHRIESVPEDVIRSLVRAGAAALQDAAAREGVPGAQPRAEVADVLLDATVLTVSDERHTVEVPLRLLSAVIRLGFLPVGSSINVDVSGRWFRVAAEYGSVYAERPGVGLGVLR